MSIGEAPAPGRGEPFPRFDVSLTHPGSNRPVHLHQVRHESLFPGSRTWIGRVNPDSLDELVLTLTDDAVSGSLTLGLETWTIRGTPGNLEVEQVDDSLDDEGDHIVEMYDDTGGEPGVMSTLSTSSGPFGLGDVPVVDLLVVYSDDAVDAFGGSEADLRTKLINNVGVLSNALVASEVEGRVRLVGLEKIDWSPSQFDPEKPGFLLTSETLDELEHEDGVADDALLLRDALGADLVVGVVPPMTASGTAGGAVDPGPSTTHRAFSLRGTNAPDTTLAHEIGHLGGLNHWRDEVYEDENGNPIGLACDAQSPFWYRYGFNWPTAADPIHPTVDVCESNGIRTLMGNGEINQTITHAGSTFTIVEDDFRRIARFANPDLDHTFTCEADHQTYVAPTGSELRNWDVGGCSARAAWRLSETWPILSEYRPMKPSTTAADLLSPTPGSVVNGSATFEWEGTSPVDTYWLEVYDPSTGTRYVDAMALSSQSTVTETVSGLPTGSDLLAVRLWTYFGTEQGWLFKDYRFNSELSLVGCGDEDPSLTPIEAFSGATCSDTAGLVCWHTSLGRLSCDLDSSIYHPGVRYGAIVSDFHPGDAYDFLMYGTTTAGSFCCLLHDPNDQITQVRLYGTDQSDILAFRDPFTGHQLQAYGNQTLRAYAHGYDGDDEIDGSSSIASNYFEYLNGNDDNDTIRGHDGDDRLYGGAGNDDMFGGAGDDFLNGGSGDDIIRGGPGNDELFDSTGNDESYAGAGNDVLISTDSDADDLYGQEGSDILCSDFLGDRMVGSPPGSGSGLNTLYYSEHAPGSWLDSLFGIGSSEGNGSYTFCGNDDHTSVMSAYCTSVTFADAPAVCASAGIPD